MRLVGIVGDADLPALHPKLLIYYEWLHPLLPSELLSNLMFHALLGHVRAKFFFFSHSVAPGRMKKRDFLTRCSSSILDVSKLVTRPSPSLMILGERCRTQGHICVKRRNLL